MTWAAVTRRSCLLSVVMTIAFCSTGYAGAEPNVGPGTTLGDLGLDSAVNLNAASPEVMIGDLDVDAGWTAQDASETLGFRLVADISVEPGVLPQGQAGPLGAIGVGLNGMSAIQVLISESDEPGEYEVSSMGWIEGALHATFQDQYRLDYSGYFLAESSTAGVDQLELTLNAPRGVEVLISPDSGFVKDVLPGASTTIDVNDVSTVTEGESTIVVVSYIVRSDRATSALVEFAELDGFEVDPGTTKSSQQSVRIVEGEARGAVRARMLPGREYASGVVVAKTGFNTPAASFEITAESGGALLFWPFVGAPIALALILVLWDLSGRLRARAQ